MKIKFCPQCGSINVKAFPTGDHCTKCNYSGEMKEDSMDEINKYVKSLKNGVPVQQGQNAGQKSGTSNAQLKAKLEAMRGMKTTDVEFL